MTNLINTTEVTDELRTAMCDWISECGNWQYEEDEEEAREGECDKALVRWIEKNYAGGMRAFQDTL